jgi:hypothetical protein
MDLFRKVGLSSMAGVVEPLELVHMVRNRFVSVNTLQVLILMKELNLLSYMKSLMLLWVMVMVTMQFGDASVLKSVVMVIVVIPVKILFALTVLGNGKHPKKSLQFIIKNLRQVIQLNSETTVLVVQSLRENL